MSRPAEVDDAKNEDFQMDKEDNDDDGGGAMKGEDGISEVEEMHRGWRSRLQW